MRKEKVFFNKPVYVGMTILDNSKILMYDFYYNNFKKKYSPRCNLLYTDTDSLSMEIQTDDVYKDMEGQKDLYDTSDYPKEHPLYSEVNKKVLGKMKDEMNGKPISECVCLRPKMYSILTHGKNIKKEKGVKKCVGKKKIRHEQYKEALDRKKTLRHRMNILRSEGHEIYGMRQPKISLCPSNSKRWIAENGIDTFSYGYQQVVTDDEFYAALIEIFMD